VVGPIQQSETLDCFIHKIPHVVFVFVPDVRMNEHGVCAELQELGNQRLALIVSTAGDDDLWAVLRKDECGSPTNAGQGAGNQPNWRTHRCPSSTGETMQTRHRITRSRTASRERRRIDRWPRGAHARGPALSIIVNRLEREQLERLEKARVGRLLAQAKALREAQEIRAYVCRSRPAIHA
jgi:hypothetical protein